MAQNTVMVSEQEMQTQREYMKKVKSILENRYGAEQPKAYTHTYGCQGNVADGQRLNSMLENMGYSFTDDVEQADFVLYNTCAVREHAEDRVFGNVGALKHIKSKYPRPIIAVCGCMMQQEHIANKMKKSYPFVDLVFGTHVTHKLPEFIYNVLTKKGRVYDITESDGVIFEGVETRRDSKFKAFIPINYGCNNFCSYCIVPYVRGRERSRDFDVIVNEAKELVNNGYKEISLIGQNVNSYGNDIGDHLAFPRLLKAINDIEGDFLIRFMTSHPKDCSKELLETMAQCEKVERHIHLPFQSGNNRVLKEMNRKYTREHYLNVVNYARELMPDISFTSDVIVGFPGETYEEFCDTLSLVEEVKYTSLYTFIYSKREGTRAAKMPDPVSRDEKSKWFKELTTLQEKIAGERTAKMKNKVCRVLAESIDENNKVSGRTSQNVIIEFKGTPENVGKFVNVKVTNPRTWILRGELVD